MKKKFRLIEIEEERKNSDFFLILRERGESGYGGSYRVSEEFDTEEEALAFVERNEFWHYTDFVILSVYYYVPE